MFRFQERACEPIGSRSAFAGGFRHEGRDLLLQVHASTMRTSGLLFLIFAKGNNCGEGFLALFTDIVIGRHDHPSFEVHSQIMIRS